MKITSVYPPGIANIGNKRYVVGGVDGWVEIDDSITLDDIEWVRVYPEDFRLDDTYLSRMLGSISKKGKVVKTVTGSRGETYTIRESNGKLSCTCKGYTFRGKCKHTVSN